MNRSSFKMIFFALKISRGDVCCMIAALLFQLLFIFENKEKKNTEHKVAEKGVKYFPKWTILKLFTRPNLIFT